MKMHQQMFYFETKDTAPTEEDGDRLFGLVLAFDGNGWTETPHYHVRVDGTFTHWMQMPKHPSEDDREA